MSDRGRIRAGIDAGKQALRERAEQVAPVFDATPTLPAPTKLCIGMATYDDFDGVWFTIASILMYHPEVVPDLSFIVIDNHPTGEVSRALKELENKFPRYRYVPFRSYTGTAVRDLVFREAQAEVVCCVDSHVLIRPGGLAALLRYFEARPDSRDLVQGPMLSPDMTSVYGTHWDPIWGAGMLGKWGNNHEADSFSEEPYDIPSQGLGLFACRKAAWPGFHPLMRQFGGEEGYLHEKMRRLGGRTVGLPALAWGHRFERPRGIAYPHLRMSFVRNYELGWAELGIDPEPGRRHYREELNAAPAMLAEAQNAVTHPLAVFDAVMAINMDAEHQRWASLTHRMNVLGIDWRLERIPAVPTPDNHHIGCALSWRAAIVEAKRRGLASVLVLEDDVVFRTDALEHLEGAVAELAGREWDLVYLGMQSNRGCREPLPDAQHLVSITRAMGNHAVVVSARVFDAILAGIPPTVAEATAWVAQNHAVGHWFGMQAQQGLWKAFCVAPDVALQEVTLKGYPEDVFEPERFPLVPAHG